MVILLVPFEMVDNGIALAFFDKSIETGCCCDGRVMTTSDGDDASAFISSKKIKLLGIINHLCLSFCRIIDRHFS